MPKRNFWLANDRPANPGARNFKGTGNDSPSPWRSSDSGYGG